MIPSTGGRARATCITLSVLLSIAMMAGPKGAEASTITLATPAGLQAGDAFRFTFVTSTTRDATSSSMSDYDTFVNDDLAAQGGAYYDGKLVSDWRAIASTLSISAKDHISLPGDATSRGYYQFSGQVVAKADPADQYYLWNGYLILNALGGNGAPEIWTGTNRYGEQFYSPRHQLPSGQWVDSQPYTLGTLEAIKGNGGNRDRAWVEWASESSAANHFFYGVSPLLVVPGAVPEIDPATGGSALSLVAGVLAMIEQRRRRVALVA